MIKKIKAWWRKLTSDQPPVPEGYFRCEQCGQPCEEEYKMGMQQVWQSNL